MPMHPLFYIDNPGSSLKEIELNEETSKHIVQVLRIKRGEKINLTDGKGTLLTAEIIDEDKKHCPVRVLSVNATEYRAKRIAIAISLLKNAHRFEWFLEKATEIGVSEIIPLLCERTEKEKFRYDRMNSICISAMLQSQQTWLPVLHQPVEFDSLLIRQFENYQKMIAHCDEGNKRSLTDLHFNSFSNCIICIGPEGDFTRREIEVAIENKFIPVSLGETRLRTETAGIVAAALLSSF